MHDLVVYFAVAFGGCVCVLILCLNLFDLMVVICVSNPGLPDLFVYLNLDLHGFSCCNLVCVFGSLIWTVIESDCFADLIRLCA